MARIVHVSATYEVDAGTAASGEVDIAGLSPDEIAELADQLHPGISVCHQCAHEISDPEVGEMTSLVVDGVEYVKVNGHWQPDNSPS